MSYSELRDEWDIDSTIEGAVGEKWVKFTPIGAGLMAIIIIFAPLWIIYPFFIITTIITWISTRKLVGGSNKINQHATVLCVWLGMFVCGTSAVVYVAYIEFI